MNFREFLNNNFVILDGGMGTLLQSAGLAPGEPPELWNLTRPDIIRGVHRDYFNSGSNVVNTNTFGANILNFSLEELEKIIAAAVANAKAAREESTAKGEKFVALDIGPTGKLLRPFGDFDFEEAVAVFAQTVKLGVKYGVDLITVETMNDSYETKAALLAVKENCELPVIVTNAYGEDGKLMTGATPSAMAAMLEGLGADAIGANCSLGPAALRSVADELISVCSVPVVIKPNAGMPTSVGGVTVFDVKAEEFSEELCEMAKHGVRVLGGCCGTTPEYISALCDKLRNAAPMPVEKKQITSVSSFARCVRLGGKPVLIGERINPTGKKRFKLALEEHDIGFILGEGIKQEEAGADILDVNVGMPGIDEKQLLFEVVTELQAITPLPLQIDTADPVAMERAMRIYNGKPLVNSVNGKDENMRAIFPLVKKYGGTLIALTLDEGGIPDSAEGRVKIAEKILRTAAEYGIEPKDIVFDPLTMAVSAAPNSGRITLNALEIIKNRLGCHTSLGVSNISYGLPERDTLNAVFFTEAMERGLSAAIMNPMSEKMMSAYYAYSALNNMDDSFNSYIAYATKGQDSSQSKPAVEDKTITLKDAVTKGLAVKAAELTQQLLKTSSALDIINGEIIPALDTVGVGYENKTVYLPGLLMSAEAAKAAFEQIKRTVSAAPTDKSKTVILATVKGDIHDIGKNIVKLLMENYGYPVIDLGKDVPPEEVLKAAIENNARLVGLSALMTTTVPSMEETIKLIHANIKDCKVMVGGAVLTADYAETIGADAYAKDAMASVRIAEKIFNDIRLSND